MYETDEFSAILLAVDLEKNESWTKSITFTRGKKSPVFELLPFDILKE